METTILKKSEKNEVINILKNGGVIAFPTDTVFGLAVAMNQPVAVNKLRQIKERPDHKPFPVMIANVSQLESLAKLTHRDRKIINRWMPGALTIVLNKLDHLAVDSQPQFSTIGLRMPNDPWLLEILEAVGPMYVPSANISEQPPASNFEEAYQVFNGLIDAIVVGQSNTATPSTVLDASSEELKILRQGELTLDSINQDLHKDKSITIALASDHGGFDLKEDLKVALEKWGYTILDFGGYDENSVDYPDTVYPAAKAVASQVADLGVVFCGTGIGASIVANKVKGVRCALVNDIELAKVTREHNDSNVLAIGGRVVDKETMLNIVSIWLSASFSQDERHSCRIQKVKDIENEELHEG